MKRLRERSFLLGWMGIFALLMFSLAAIGGFKSYSSIPFWDMWSGVYGFILAVQDGDSAQWWSQHNEHRIVLARIFFWIDYAFFGFKAAFLFVCNYVFVALAGWLFTRFIFKVAKGDDENRNAAKVLALFIFGWLFLWTQKENLVWGFQSQFFLAQLIPLAMFYLLAASAAKGSNAAFVGACVMGVLSAGTMANGVMALPLAFVMSCFLPFTRTQRASLLLLAIGVPLIYFIGYTQPAGHGSLSKTLMADPLGVLRYAMIYIGSPFYVLAHKSRNALVIAEVFGGILIFASVVAASTWVFSSKKQPFVGALLFFILFIGGTAVGTAGGRLLFGLVQATAERYTTPAVMAWAAILIVYFSYFKRFESRWWKLGSVFLVIVTVSLLAYQAKAARQNHEVKFGRNIGALAATLGVGDERYIKQVSFSVEYAIDIGKQTEQRQLGFVTFFPFAGMAQSIGNKLPSVPATTCQGGFDQVEYMPLGNGYVRVEGWAYDSNTRTVPEKWALIDGQDRVIGFVLTGKSRGDLRTRAGDFAKRSGFVGYVKSTALGQPVKLVASDSSCSIPGALPRLVFERSADLQQQVPSLRADAFVAAEGFNGKTNVPAASAPGSTIYSSYINGDADVGIIKLRVKNGDVLMYRTGPIAERQWLRSSVADVSLPLASEWSALRFIGFPDNALHEIGIEDAGNAWGEWSAIALRTH